jgi:hypothetical protein
MPKVFLSLRKNTFFIFASLLTYTVGSIFAGFQNSNFDWISFIVGILVFFTILSLQQLFNYLSTSKINPYSRVSFERGNKKSQLFILTIFLFFAYLFLIYSTLRMNRLIGVNLIYISLLTFLMLITIFRIGKMLFQTSSVIIEGVIVSPLMLLLGTGMQGTNPTSGHVLLTMAFFFLYVADRTSLLFEQYELDQKTGERSFLQVIGWENGIKILNVSMLLTYLVFSLYFYRNATLGVNLPILITAIIGIFSMYLLNRMVMGMKPHWHIIRATAFLHFFAVCYLLVYPLF